MSDEPEPVVPSAAPNPSAPGGPTSAPNPVRNPVVTTLYWLLFVVTAGGLLLSTACTLAVYFSPGGELDLSSGAFVIGGPFMLVFGGLAYWFWRLARRQ